MKNQNDKENIFEQKEIILTSKNVKIIQISLFVSILIVFALLLILILPNVETIRIYEIIKFGFLFIGWLYLIFLVLRIAEVKIAENKLLYKKLFSDEKHVKVEDITKIKIIFKQFVRVKFIKSGKTGNIWINKPDKLSKISDTYRIIMNAKKKLRKTVNRSTK